MSGESSARYGGLDALRGMVIALMMFVNCAGHDPAFPGWVAHRGWNEGRQGLGLADYVFPLFIFIMGTGVRVSYLRGLARGDGAWAWLKRAAMRAGVLYGCGVVLKCAAVGYDGRIGWSVLVHWDILPMLAWSGLLTALLQWAPGWGRGAFVVGAVVWKWYLLGVMGVEGAAGHVWTPEVNAQRELIGKLGWIGVGLTQGMGAAAVCVLGAEAGAVMARVKEVGGIARASAWMAGVGAAMAAASYIWHRVGMPYSKDFFTASYVVLMAGVGLMGLGACWWVVDGLGAAKLGALRVLGRHALGVYVTAELLWRCVLTRWKVGTPDGGGSVAITSAKAWASAWMGPTLGAWATVGVYVIAWFAFAWWLEGRGKNQSSKQQSSTCGEEGHRP
jgi:predicted acyltransferase